MIKPKIHDTKLNSVRRNLFETFIKFTNANLIFLLFEQPIDVVVLVSLFGHNNVFGTDDVEERLSLRMLC